MLLPIELSACASDAAELYAQLDESICEDIARRIVKTCSLTESAKIQAAAANESGLLYDEIIRKIAGYSKMSEKQVKAIFEDSALKSTKYDFKIYDAAGLSPIPLNLSKSALQILSANYVKTNNMLKNLTMTSALGYQQTFISACTLAEMQIESGAFSPQTAIRNAVKQASREGATVRFQNCRRSLESAVETAVRTGVGQTCRQIGLDYAKQLEVDLMEITAHSGARPSHSVWQGQLVSLSGQRGYLSLSDIGYDSGDGFGGWNCRHDWNPFIEGISTRNYTDEQIQALNDKTVTYNGKTYSVYEAEQKQRSIERDIRKTKRELLSTQAARKEAKAQNISTPELEADWEKLSKRLAKQREKYSDFCSQTDFLPQNNRTQALGFNRSAAKKAEWRARKADNSLANTSNGGIIKESTNLPITPISDTAIKKVALVNLPGYTAEQSRFIQEQHKELLRYAREKNDSKEVAFVFNKDLSRRSEFTGSDDRLNFGSGLLGKGDGLFVMHNHPRNSSFSNVDIQLFISNDNIRIMTIVKNNGSIEALIKTDIFSKSKISTLYGRALKKYVKTSNVQEIDKALNYLLANNGGNIKCLRL